MKAMVCEMCNSNDMLKQDGMFVCQSCGTKYTVEEAKKLMIEGTVDVQGTVKVDNTAFVEKYLANARRAKQKEDWKEAEKYYNMVEQNDPTNIEAIFYSSFARVKTALLEPETKDKRQSVFNVLEKSVSVIDDNYDVTNKEHQKLVFEILDDIIGLKKGTIVPTTHLQDYVTRNGYYEIVDRTQILENDSINITYNMIDDVANIYRESLANIIEMQCKVLTNEEILENGYEFLKKSYGDNLIIFEDNLLIFSVAVYYLSEYTKKNPNSPVGFAAAALQICNANLGEEAALMLLRKAAQLTTQDCKEKEILTYIINCECGEELATLFIVAAAHYDYEVVKFLVEAGADINATTLRCVTALWYVSHITPGSDKVESARKIAKLLLDNGAEIDIKHTRNGIALYNRNTDPVIAQMIKAKYPNAIPMPTIQTTATSSGCGCYVATAVYGSYDCAEVWTLRRFRDDTLASTWYGRAFIKTYYAISPTLVKWFGDTQWFKNMWKPTLDKMVRNLNNKGVENTPYDDKQW